MTGSRWIGASVAALVLAGAGVAMAARSRPDTAGPAVAPGQARNAVLHALTTSPTIRYPGVDAVLRAASAADESAVRVTAREATEKFAKNPIRPELARGPRVLRLVRYTDMSPQVRDALAWAVIVPDAPLVIYNQRAAGDISGTCDFVVLVDARSAEYIGGFQSCDRELGTS